MFTSLLPSLILALPPAPEVLVVDSFAGPGEFTQIYEAVAAAHSGDTILVRSGFYIGFVVTGKDLVITEDEGAQANLEGGFTVQDVEAHQTVVIRGLSVFPQPGDVGATIRNAQGPVWFEDVNISDSYIPQFPKPGLLVEDSASVTLVGGRYDGSRSASSEAGPGLFAARSNVQVYGSEIVGGRGSAFLGVQYDGGEGVRLESGRLYAAGATLRGGDGGNGNGFGCTDGSDGGPGLFLGLDSPAARLLGSIVEGGAAGPSVAPCVPGLPGAAQVVQSGTVGEDPYSARELSLEPVVQAGAPLEVSVRGEPGDVVLLYQAAGLAPRTFAGNGGSLVGGVLLPGGEPGVVLFLGRVGPTGTLARTLRAPLVPAAETFFSQGVVHARTGEVLFSTGASTTVLP